MSLSKPLMNVRGQRNRPCGAGPILLEVGEVTSPGAARLRPARNRHRWSADVHQRALHEEGLAWNRGQLARGRLAPFTVGVDPSRPLMAQQVLDQEAKISGRPS